MDRQKLKEKLKEYMEIPRMSGYEKEMAVRFLKDMEQYTDQLGRFFEVICKMSRIASDDRIGQALSDRNGVTVDRGSPGSGLR